MAVVWPKAEVVDYKGETNMECSICSLILNDPVSIMDVTASTLCGHLYCRACITEWFRTKPGQCTQCAKTISKHVLVSDVGIARRIGNVHVECEWKKDGCAWKNEYGFQGNVYAEHLKKFCKYAPAECTWCSTKIPRHKMEKHLVTNAAKHLETQVAKTKDLEKTLTTALASVDRLTSLEQVHKRKAEEWEQKCMKRQTQIDRFASLIFVDKYCHVPIDLKVGVAFNATIPMDYGIHGTLEVKIHARGDQQEFLVIANNSPNSPLRPIDLEDHQLILQFEPLDADTKRPQYANPLMKLTPEASVTKSFSTREVWNSAGKRTHWLRFCIQRIKT